MSVGEQALGAFTLTQSLITFNVHVQDNILLGQVKQGCICE